METERTAARFGFGAALGTALATALTFGVAIATPPLSGDFCEAGCFHYPFLDVAGRFPRDYAWMFLAIGAMFFVLAFVVALYGRARPERRSFALFALIVAAMGTLVIVGDYFVQVAVVQPSLVAGEADGVSMLTQYNPHGLFIGLEELGYLLVSLSLVTLVPALPTATRPERTVRWLFAGGALTNAAALAWFAVKYGHQRGYRFEIVVLSVDWLMLIVGGALMAVVFRRELHPSKPSR